MTFPTGRKQGPPSPGRDAQPFPITSGRECAPIFGPPGHPSPRAERQVGGESAEGLRFPQSQNHPLRPLVTQNGNEVQQECDTLLSLILALPRLTGTLASPGGRTAPGSLSQLSAGPSSAPPDLRQSLTVRPPGQDDPAQPSPRPQGTLAAPPPQPTWAAAN